MLVEIQSVSDIITNSSSEVFITNNKRDIEILDKAGITYVKFDTEEDIRNYLFSEDSYNLEDLDEFVNYNPFGNYFELEELLKIHTKDEIWEFFKPLYTCLLGNVYVNVDRDFYYSKLENVRK